MKSPERVSSRLKMSEERISKSEDRSLEIIQSEEQREKVLKKNKQSLIELWDKNKHTNMCVMGIPERNRKKERINIWRNNGLLKFDEKH